jgi:hypothetical protein
VFRVKAREKKRRKRRQMHERFYLRSSNPRVAASMDKMPDQKIILPWPGARPPPCDFD